MDNQELLNAIADLLSKELGEMRDEIKDMKGEIRGINERLNKLETGQEQMREEMREMKGEIKDLKTEMREMHSDLSGQIADGIATLTEYFGEEISKVDRKVNEADAIAMRALRETALLSAKKN